jgi:predicted helicase
MNQEENKAKIYYFSVPDGAKKEEKLNFLKDTQFQNIPFERIRPDAKGNWLNEGIQEDWESLIPLCDKEVKNNKSGNAIFKLFSLGVSTNRDEWVYDFDKINLENKIKFFIETFNTNPLAPLTEGTEEFSSTTQDLQKDYINESKPQNQELSKTTETDETPPVKGARGFNTTIKWSRDLKKKFKQNKKLIFNKNLIISSNYRPFTQKYWYSEKVLNDILTQNHYDMFSRELDLENICLTIHNHAQLFDFTILATRELPDAGFSGRGTPFTPLYVYEVPHKLVESGSSEIKRIENITDWALKLFRERYEAPQPPEGQWR